MLEGRYDDACLKAAGKDAPKFTDDEVRLGLWLSSEWSKLFGG
jgi:hypothetical protein